MIQCKLTCYTWQQTVTGKHNDDILMSVGFGATGPMELRRRWTCALCFFESRWNEPPWRSCQDVSTPTSSSCGTSCISLNMTDMRDFLRPSPGAAPAAGASAQPHWRSHTLYLRPHAVVAAGILFFNRSFFLSFFSFANGSLRWLYRQGTFIAQKVGYRCSFKNWVQNLGGTTPY